MTQTIIALFIVALALVWVLMQLRKGNKSQGCNCGCDSCSSKHKKNCPGH